MGNAEGTEATPPSEGEAKEESQAVPVDCAIDDDPASRTNATEAYVSVMKGAKAKAAATGQVAINDQGAQTAAATGQVPSDDQGAQTAAAAGQVAINDQGAQTAAATGQVPSDDQGAQTAAATGEVASDDEGLKSTLHAVVGEWRCTYHCLWVVPWTWDMKVEAPTDGTGNYKATLTFWGTDYPYEIVDLSKPDDKENAVNLNFRNNSMETRYFHPGQYDAQKDLLYEVLDHAGFPDKGNELASVPAPVQILVFQRVQAASS